MKSNKVIIIFLPVFVIYMGWLFWKDYMPKSNTSEVRKVDEDVFNVKVDRRDSVPKKNSEMYKKKWQREKDLARKVENSDDFFATEVKKEPAIEDEKPVLEDPVLNKEEVKEKPKVVVVYRDKPVDKKSVPVDTFKPAVKPKRFLSGDVFKSGNIGKDKGTVESTGKVAISVKAVTQYDQTVLNGSDLTIRLTEDMVLPNVIIPRNTLVTGRITFSDQRAAILVSSVVKSGTSYPVSLKAFAAADGVEGIAIPSATNQQVSNDIMNSAVQEATRKISSPLINRSASSAGNRKVNEQTVIVPSGYELILKN